MPTRALPLQPQSMTVSESAAIHSLTWLVAANLVGVLLAALLVWPDLGSPFVPLTYGRWVPLHTSLHLYGWTSLPLVGLLLAWYAPGGDAGPLGHIALGVWSGTLVFAAVEWLAGGSSGKLFLEWGGVSRVLMFANLVVLAGVLAALAVRRSRRASLLTHSWSSAAVAAGWLLLALLASVPFVLVWAAGDSVYPSVNPRSSGATGASLLGSSLGIVTIAVLTPILLGLKAHDEGRTTRLVVGVLVLHFAWFGALDHGDVSNHQVAHIIALASLAVWLPLLTVHLRNFSWPRTTRSWLVAFAFWGTALLATGIIGFLPGVLDRWKFTNALVAHAHIAMAGLVTSFNVVVLQCLHRRSRFRAVFSAPAPFWLWHGGMVVLATTLLLVGTIEGFDPGVLFRRSAMVSVGYFVRLVSGAAMTVASLCWLVAAWRSTGTPLPSEAQA